MADDSSAAPAAPASSAPSAGVASPAAAPSSPQASAAPAASGAPSEAGGGVSQPPAPKRYPLKFGSQVQEVSEEQLIHLAQKGYGSEQVFREAAEVRKERESFLAALKDPMKAREHLQKYGADPEALMKAWVLDWHRREEMSPEQRALAEQETKLSKREEAIRAQEEERAQQALQVQTREAESTFINRWTEALNKTGAKVDAENPPPLILQLMAKYEQANRHSGLQAPPEVLAEQVVEEACEVGVQGLGLLLNRPADLVKRLGPELVAAVCNEVVRQSDEAAGLAPRAPAGPQMVSPPKPREANGQFRSAREQRDALYFKSVLGQ